MNPQKKIDPEAAKSLTPNAHLALEVVGAFRDAHYLRPDDLARLGSGLNDGSVKAEDWISFAENALQTEQALGAAIKPEVR